MTRHGRNHRGRRGLTAALLLYAATGIASAAAAAPDYRPIEPTQAARIVTLTGKDLTVADAVAVARYGAKVELSAAAKRRQAEAYGLLLQAAAEGVSIYRFNRGAGSQREVVTFTGDPMRADNRELIARRLLVAFEAGARAGLGPEVAEEEIVRALMVVRANSLTRAPASPALMRMLIDLLNNRITPVVQSRGTLGEGDLPQIGNVEGTMVGKGDCYYRGVRMPASQALQLAGLRPLAPFGADDAALDVTNAYATGQALLLVADGAAALNWADLTLAIDLNGMNSSITPLTRPVQDARPFKALNADAARVLDMIDDSYLFQDDRARIIQDPESLRASSIRQGSAWKAWAALRDTVTIQINASDNNPAVAVGLGPTDSRELATPYLMRFYVRGGDYSHGQHGYVVSNANWDPYPMANEVEAFTNALTNMDVAVTQRIDRFSNSFFTVVKAADVLPPPPRGYYASGVGSYTPVDIWQEVASIAPALTPEGQAIVATVEDLQAQTRLKLQRARRTVDLTIDLLAQDLMVGTYWLDVRRTQDPGRRFGKAPTAAWTAFRQVIPLAAESRPNRPAGDVTAAWLRSTPATAFYPSGENSF